MPLYSSKLFFVILLCCSLLIACALGTPVGMEWLNCGLNSFWTPFGTDCPPSCENGGMPPPCIKMFVAGCQCMHGFVFARGKSGDCIRLAECYRFGFTGMHLL